MKAYILLFLLFIPLAFAQDIPQLRASVTDNADIISLEYEQQITAMIQGIEQATTAEIAILTVPSFEGLSKEEYAYEVFDKNKIGKKDVDNGLLILVGIAEREYRVEVGYGLEGLIPDAKKVDIGVVILETNFKEGNFDKGLHDAVKAIGELLQGQEEVLSQYKTLYPPRRSTGSLIYSFITFLIFLSIISSIFRKKGGSGWMLIPLFIGGPGWNNGTGGFGNSGFGGFSGGFSGGGGFGGGF